MNDSEIRKALDDIAELKKSVRGNLKIIRPVMLDRAFIPLCYIAAALLSVGFSTVHFLGLRYGSLALLPSALKLVLAVALVLAFVASGLIKLRIIRRNFARQNRTLSYRELFKFPDFRNLYLLILYGLLLLLVAVGSAAAHTGNWWTLLPAFSLYYAFIIALLALMLTIPEYLVQSLIGAAFGITSLLWMKDSQFLWLAAFCAIVLVSFGLVIQFARGNRIIGGQTPL